MSKYAVIGFLGVIVFGSVFINCNVPPVIPPDLIDTLKVSNVSISAGGDYVSALYLNFDGKGKGEVTVDWYGRYDLSGSHLVETDFVDVDGQNTYQAQYGTGYGQDLEFYFFAVALDSTGAVFDTSDEVFCGTGPKTTPGGYINYSPRTGHAPLSVNFDYYEDEPWDSTFYGAWDYDGDGVYGEDSHTYTEPGQYHPALKVGNRWGEEVIHGQQTIHVYGE